MINRIENCKLHYIIIEISSSITFTWLTYLLKGSNDANKMAKSLNNSSLNFKYSTLEKATGSFAEANKLGQGGFGTVYKASLLLFASNMQLI